ncbi:PucR family transcriptional regulator [Paenibacillus radicis (ex Xue et al. 2023)]|uniref:PucR family transcriptional regulator ligand-binding domain-containing protein n=1 Tax=Paenibacillus radicis (ex Xue et al. 2023) TaxID=2972489 RepID=A0ABT1YB77_9BACL|nr:PucR family transcriptional regulator [Paenibacillus radicis (ex Xue et al. 2023)]MCR8630446.1 PucR family transcriptional regulator ligand-binding domain-containing protein [Paenibacillus radicis (ex Xue et al. 2023)]
MDITVQEALQIYPLSEGKLVAGAQGVSRVISALNLMEAPDIYNSMNEGALLLTTGYAIKESSESFVHLLQNLNACGSSGLGIKLGRYGKKIPNIVIEEADRLQFPLIELPSEITFSEQITALFHTQFERNKKLNQVLDMQKRLVDFAMQANDNSDYFVELSEILQCQFAVIDSWGKMLYNSTGCKEQELLRNWPWEPDYKLSRIQDNMIYRIPLLKSGKCLGYFLVMSASLSDGSSDKGVYHQAAVILSYHLEDIQNYESLAADQRLGNAIERYLQQQISQEEVIDQAITFRGNIWKGAYLCILTPVHSGSGDPAWKKSVLRSIHESMKNYQKMAACESHHLFVHNKLLSLFSLPEKNSADLTYIEQLTGSYAQLLGLLMDNPQQSFVSSIKHRLESLMDGYEQCVEAQRISEQLSLDSAIISFPDLEFFYILRHIPVQVMTKYTDSLLYPLLQKDEDYMAEMLRTLDAYFINNGLINDTAKELYIHRNTVLYRMEKIGELLKIDLKKPNDLLKIKLALMFRRLLK